MRLMWLTQTPYTLRPLPGSLPDLGWWPSARPGHPGVLPFRRHCPSCCPLLPGVWGCWKFASWVSCSEFPHFKVPPFPGAGWQCSRARLGAEAVCHWRLHELGARSPRQLAWWHPTTSVLSSLQTGCQPMASWLAAWGSAPSGWDLGSQLMRIGARVISGLARVAAASAFRPLVSSSPCFPVLVAGCGRGGGQLSVTVWVMQPWGEWCSVLKLETQPWRCFEQEWGWGT